MKNDFPDFENSFPTLDELKKIISECVEEVLLKHGLIKKINKGDITEENKFLNGKELCKELNITRQTLYNWIKNTDTKWLIEPYRRRSGKKWLYNIEEIIKALKKYPSFLTNRQKGKIEGFRRKDGFFLLNSTDS